MEELDILKKAWKKEENSFEQVSEKQIYTMLHQQSSSIVKLILIISILEFVFWNIIAFGMSDDKYQDKLESYGIDQFMYVINVINYAIVIGFIYVFYKNYKSISTLDSTSTLMKSILSTRKTVQNYIWYNLAIIALTIAISIYMMFSHNAEIILMTQKQIEEGHKTMFMCFCIAISIVFIAAVIGLFWLFYRLLYGILLKKLFANYKELKKIEL
jgi:NADH:ubiquinone oxidoreductase subunit K